MHRVKTKRPSVGTEPRTFRLLAGVGDDVDARLGAAAGGEGEGDEPPLRLLLAHGHGSSLAAPRAGSQQVSSSACWSNQPTRAGGEAIFQRKCALGQHSTRAQSSSRAHWSPACSVQPWPSGCSSKATAYYIDMASSMWH
jgi:hypothetical protein